MVLSLIDLVSSFCSENVSVGPMIVNEASSNRKFSSLYPLHKVYNNIMRARIGTLSIHTAPPPLHRTPSTSQRNNRCTAFHVISSTAGTLVHDQVLVILFVKSLP
jgi:hypothetical protein